MRTIKSILVLTVVTFTTINTMAQVKGTLNNQQLAQQQTDEIKKNVDKITPDETNKILPVELEFANSMQDIRNKSKGDTITANKNAVKLCKIRDGKMKTVLTSGQYSQYLDMEKGKSCKLNCTKS
jgi:hypothetical protein